MAGKRKSTITGRIPSEPTLHGISPTGKPIRLDPAALFDMGDADIASDPTRDRIFEFDSPESSTVIRGEYDWDTRQLLVTFKGGTRYRYTVSPELWNEFAMAESKGGYFAARIRPFYLGEKL